MDIYLVHLFTFIYMSSILSPAWPFLSYWRMGASPWGSFPGLSLLFAGSTSPTCHTVRGQGQLPKLSARLRSTGIRQPLLPSQNPPGCHFLWTRELATLADPAREHIVPSLYLRPCKPALSRCTSACSPRGVYEGPRGLPGTAWEVPGLRSHPRGRAARSLHDHTGAAAARELERWLSLSGRTGEAKSLTMTRHSEPHPPSASARRKEEVSASHPEDGTDLSDY